MKIFGWMQRKLQPNVDYRKMPYVNKDGFSGLADRGKAKANAEEAEALLELSNVVNLNHVLEGFLAIGTMGHDPLNIAHADTNQKLYCEELGEENDEEGHGEYPLSVVFTQTGAPELIRNPPLSGVEDTKAVVVEIEEQVAAEEEDLHEPLLKEEDKEDKRGRTTLADLFHASDELAEKSHQVPQPIEQYGKAPASERKSTSKKAKNKISRAKDGAPPPKNPKKLSSDKKKDGDSSTATPKKLSRLISKMMRKKIHPEVESRTQASYAGARAQGHPREDSEEKTGASAHLLWYVALPYSPLLLASCLSPSRPSPYPDDQ